MKSIIKKIISIVIALAVVSQLFVVTYAAENGKCGKNLTWILDKGTLVISGTGDMDDFEMGDPWGASGVMTYDKLKNVIISEGVTSVGRGAFSGCKGIESVILANSVQKIGDWAFQGCSNIRSIKLPNNLLEIGERAFSGCEMIDSIVIPSKITKISDEAFAGLGINTLTIPENIEEIGSSAFSGCNNLSEITVPSNIKKIGFAAFSGCDNVKTIYWNAEECEDFTEGSSSIIRNFDGTGANHGGFNLIFGKNVKKIPAFICYNWDNGYGDTKLKSITICGDVTEIGDSAFYGCHELATININGSINKMGSSVFTLTGYSRNENNWVDNGLYIGNSLASVKEKTSGQFIVKDGTISIASFVFGNGQSVSSVVIPTSVKNIGNMAFDMKVKDIYFKGNSNEWNYEWNNIKKLEPIPEFAVDGLYYATIHFADGTSISQSQIRVIIDGKLIDFDVQPQIINGRTMVPLRAIFEALGTTVNWDNSTQTATASNDEITISLKIGEMHINVNNKFQIELDTPAQLVDGRTLVPVRAISEVFDYNVAWDGDRNMVYITRR